MIGETYSTVLDDPQASDVDLDNRQIIVTGVPNIPYHRVVNDPAEQAAQSEQLRQVDFTPSVSDNSDFPITFTQLVDDELRQQKYRITSGSSATEEKIVDALVDKINADSQLKITASRNGSGASSVLRIDADSGYPDFDYTINSDVWSNDTENTAALYALGQGDDLIDEGFDATSGNNYALWYFQATTLIDLGAYNGENKRTDQWYIWVNEGGGSFSDFQDDLNNIIQGKAADGTATDENVALSG